MSKQKEDAEKLDPGRSHTTGTAFSFGTAHEPQHFEAEMLDSTAPADNKASSSSPVHRTDGPRTTKGKEISKYNALKHGILSKIVLLKGESRLEFDSVLNGLRNDLRPEGTLEEILVEKLASLLWRYRRMLIAEGAEIQKGTEFHLSYKSEREEQNAAIFLRSEGKVRAGLFSRIENPLIRERCVKILEHLKGSIATRGFNSSQDVHLLTVLFGDTETTAPTVPLVMSYMLCNHPAKYPDLKGLNESKKVKELMEKLATPEGRKATFLEHLQDQIDELQTYPKWLNIVTAPREKLESRCRNVPDAPELDRLLRYETNIERNIDRTLSQFEHRQRMRLGQPLLPKLEVRHSLS